MPRSRSSGRNRTASQRRRAMEARRVEDSEQPQTLAVPDVALDARPERPHRRVLRSVTNTVRKRSVGAGREEIPGLSRTTRRREGAAVGARPDRPVRRRPEVDPAIANARWDWRGFVGMSAVVALLMVPFGLSSWIPVRDGYTVTDAGGASQTYHLGLPFFVLAELLPIAIPVPLILATLIANPVVRRLTHQVRSLRVLEALGYAAVVYLFMVILVRALPLNIASYTDSKVVVALAATDAVALLGAALVYGPVQAAIGPRRRRKPEDPAA